MNDMFARVMFLRRGYKPSQVDEFFTQARSAYERPAVSDTGMSSFDVSQAAFDLAYRGYACDAVDAALDRLEAAFATRTRDQHVRAHGQQGWMELLAQRAQVLYPRLRRPAGQRFGQPRGLRRGYDARQVDTLLDRLVGFFDSGQPLTAADLREATFKRRGNRGAYDERTVDAYLSRAADILQGAQ